MKLKFLLIFTLLILVALLIKSGIFIGISIGNGSMEPVIKTGDYLVAIPADSYNVGDIICFKNADIPGGYIVHRIVEGTDADGDGKIDTYITQGDANKGPDHWLLKNENIKGRIIYGLRFKWPWKGD